MKNLRKKTKVLSLIGGILFLVGIVLKLFDTIFGAQNAVLLTLLSMVCIFLGIFLVGYALGREQGFK